MTSSTKSLCVFPINGSASPLLLFPHTFPENLHSFNLFERTCGSLHTGLCDVVNPRSDLQWKHPESDLQCSPFKWLIAPTCRPLAVSVLAFACLHKLPQGQIWSENLVFLGRKTELLAVLLLSGTPGQLQARVRVVHLVEHGAGNSEVTALIPKEHILIKCIPWLQSVLNASVSSHL